MSTTDQALLQQWVQHRDADAFRAIALRHAGMVYNTSRRILRDSHEAEEIAQECFEALVRAGDKPGAYLGAWLHRVATNLALNRAVSDRRRQIRDSRLPETETAAAGSFDAELYAHVDRAIAALPEKLRQPLVAHYLENETHESIAESIGVSRQTVTYRIGQGVERVRADLKRKGIMAGATGLSAFLLANNSEAVPAAFVATLGKLAVAGVPAAAGLGLAGIPGLISLKAALAAAAVIAVGGAGILALRPASQVGRATAVAQVPVAMPMKTAAVPPAPTATARHAKAPESDVPAVPTAPQHDANSGSSVPARSEDPATLRERTEKSLEYPVSIDFENIQLAEVLSFFGGSFGTNYVLDPRVVQPATLQTPPFATDGHVPRIDVRNVSLGEALRTLCRPLGLDFAVNGNVITVSSPDLLDADRFPRLNDSDDSSSEALQKNVSLAFEDVHLSEILTFASDTYDVNITVDHRAVAPAEGQIATGQPEPPFVTNGHVPRITLENVTVAEGLDVLLRPLNLAYSVEAGFIWVSSRELIESESFSEPDTSRAEPALVQALQTPIDFEFKKMSLPDTLAAMADKAGVSMQVDAKNAPISGETVDGFSMKDGVPFGTSLAVLLREHNLAFVTNGADIIVTSPTMAQSNSRIPADMIPMQHIVKH